MSDFCRTSAVRRRKLRYCDSCEGRITPGVRHNYHAGISDGPFRTARECWRCGKKYGRDPEEIKCPCCNGGKYHIPSYCDCLSACDVTCEACDGEGTVLPMDVLPFCEVADAGE